MPWPVILSALSLALLSAWMVVAQGWQPWLAFLVAGFGTMLLILALMMIVLLFSNERREIWNAFAMTVRNELNQSLKSFKFWKP